MAESGSSARFEGGAVAGAVAAARVGSQTHDSPPDHGEAMRSQVGVTLLVDGLR
ncbi:hypothetical protein J2S55_007449 [Streptosporangium brasiliense]|uniref:Uncharacterized protein n=1 Tax=Streptosporangium brasiliense TaxID=47480 RepID=A0ABT9RFX5_9ACTN|nr:hypothetical protein [Streptosporangium brasiliense]